MSASCMARGSDSNGTINLITHTRTSTHVRRSGTKQTRSKRGCELSFASDLETDKSYMKFGMAVYTKI
jgi:hypothetical protein